MLTLKIVAVTYFGTDATMPSRRIKSRTRGGCIGDNGGQAVSVNREGRRSAATPPPAFATKHHKPSSKYRNSPRNISGGPLSLMCDLLAIAEFLVLFIFFSIFVFIPCRRVGLRDLFTEIAISLIYPRPVFLLLPSPFSPAELPFHSYPSPILIPSSWNVSALLMRNPA